MAAIHISHLACPACQSAKVRSHGKRYAIYPYGLLAVFGLLFATLHQASAPMDYECGDCGSMFSRRSGLARLGLVILFLGLIAVALVVVVALLDS